MISILLPDWSPGDGGTSLLIVPAPESGIIHTDYNSNRLIVGLDETQKQLKIESRTHRAEFVLHEDDALALVSCILSKLYYVRGHRR